VSARGFTLFELLVVIAIIGILAAAAIPRFGAFRALAYDARAEQDLRSLAAAEELYRAEHPAYASDPAALASFTPSEGVVVRIERADAAVSAQAPTTRPAAAASAGIRRRARR